MPHLLVALAALCTSGLTLYSGFGLGTLLLPVFALFFPVEVAVGATAVVHGANNLFKVSLVGRHADRDLVLRFGIPAILAAFAGAAALGWVARHEPLATWELGSHEAVITPVKLAVGALMLVFAAFELAPRLKGLRFDRRHLVVGGVLSGFCGGFSGHQGALRSAFLTKMGITTEAFVGTTAVIGFLVDAARLLTYAALAFLAGASTSLGDDQWPLVVSGTAGAFVGVLVGRRFLHKITMGTVRLITGVLLVLVALGLGSGLV